MSEDESGLIKSAQQGDAAACATLYNQYYDAVYRYCYYRVSDTALAQDLTSEVFVRMVENLAAFNISGRPLLAWLYTIARNLIADTFRQRKQISYAPLDELHAVGEQDPAQSMDHRLQAACLASGLKRLTEDQRQVIILKFVENYTNAEVAHMLDKPIGAIKSLQYRALTALRRALKKERCYEV